MPKNNSFCFREQTELFLGFNLVINANYYYIMQNVKFGNKYSLGKFYFNC